MGSAAEEWLATLRADPVKGAVTLGTTTLRNLAMMSQKAGQPVAPAVLMHVGLTLCKDIAGVANAAGLVPDDQLEGYLRSVMQQSIAEYLHMDAQDGLLSPQDKQRAQQMMGEGKPAGMLARMQDSGGDEGGAPEASGPGEPDEDENTGMLARMQKGKMR